MPIRTVWWPLVYDTLDDLMTFITFVFPQRAPNATQTGPIFDTVVTFRGPR
jgi:hypothetical protein